MNNRLTKVWEIINEVGFGDEGPQRPLRETLLDTLGTVCSWQETRGKSQED